jgi:hypothetical protein
MDDGDEEGSMRGGGRGRRRLAEREEEADRGMVSFIGRKSPIFPKFLIYP